MLRTTVFWLCTALVWTSPSVRKSAPRPKIVGGTEASPGELPFVAALFLNDGSGSNRFCGGAIIGQEWILTAAQCLDGILSVQAVTGSINPQNGVVTNSINLIPHERYDTITLENNIGLVQLDTPLSFDGNTAAARLHQGSLQTGEIIRVSGWGYTSDSDDTISDVLNYIDLAVIDSGSCEETYGEDQITEDMVCAAPTGGQAQSTCSGDSGSPAVTDARELAAVATFHGPDGCETSDPSGYTRVEPYLQWIQQHTGITL